MIFFMIFFLGGWGVGGPFKFKEKAEVKDGYLIIQKCLGPPVKLKEKSRSQIPVPHSLFKNARGPLSV